MADVIEDGNRQVTDKALMEVFRRMEPLIRALLKGVGGGNATDAVRFNNANLALALRFLHFVTNDADADGYGVHVNDDSAVHGSLYEAEQSILLRRQDGQISVLIGDAFGGLTLHSTDRVLVDAESFVLAASTTIDGGANVASNFADGVVGGDLATIGQVAGAVLHAIFGDAANTPGYLKVTTTGGDGDGYAIRLHDGAVVAGNGVLVESDNADVGVTATLGAVTITGTDCQVTVDDNGFAAIVPTGKTFAVLNHLAAAILSVDEATGAINANGGKVTGVASPSGGSDAVNLSYLGGAIADAESYADAAVAAFDIAAKVHAATGKTTPADNDELALVDSAASNVLKKLLWSNVKATLKTYFDGLYTALGASAPPNGSAGGTLGGTYPNPTVNTDGSTLETSASALRVKDGGITSAKLASGVVPAFATPAVVLGSAAAAGAAGTVIRSDGTIAAFDTTVPSTQAFGDAAAIGTAAFAARRDHKHAMMADPFLGTTAAAAIGGVFWTVVTKGSDTSRDTTTTLSADPDLAFTAASGGVYEFEFFVIYGSPAGGATPDMKATVFGEDATARGSFVPLAGLSSSDAATTSNGVVISNASSSVNYGTAATNRAVKFVGWYVGAGGTLSLVWAQATSGGNATIVRAGSVLRYRRIV